uniref:FlgD Ig-like domain-containing protein n=1 Tax=candidate division WOR-3 bacterium TaxID=2052148 RepID=A0A7C4U773_UNCW3
MLTISALILLIKSTSFFKLNQVQDETKKKVEFKAQTIIQIVSSVVLNPLLEEDELTLNEIVKNVKEKDPQIKYSEILNTEGNVLAHNEFDKIGTVEKFQEGISENESLYIFTSPIKLKDKTIAYFSLGFDKSSYLMDTHRSKNIIEKWVNLFVLLFFFCGLILLIFLSSLIQKSVFVFVKKTLNGKDEEIRLLLKENTRLQKLLEETTKKVIQEVVEEENLAHSGEKEFKIDIPKEPIKEKEVSETYGIEEELKIMEENLEESKKIKEEVPIGPVVSPEQGDKPIEVVDAEPEMVDIETPNASFTQIINNKEESKVLNTELTEEKEKFSDTPKDNALRLENTEELKKIEIEQTEPITIISVSPDPFVLGNILEIKISLLNNTSLLVIIENQKEELTRVFSYDGKKGENIITWEGKDLLNNFVAPGVYTITITEKKIDGAKVSTKTTVKNV